MKTLANLAPGKKAVIKKIQGNNPQLVTRLMELGMVEGTEIEVSYTSPFGGALAIECRGGLIAVRTSDADHIEVFET